MKRLLSLLLAIVLTLCLAACGNEETSSDSSGTTSGQSQTETSDPTDTSTDETTNTTDPSGEGSTSTPTTTPTTQPTDPTVGTTPTTPENTKPTETNPPHTHSYSSKVTKTATCTAEGTKTFTCSCGNSYTEKIAVTGHTWGAWKTETCALVNRVGKEKRTCSTCSTPETRDTTAGVLVNSFDDPGLEYIFYFNGSISASTLLDYAAYTNDDFVRNTNSTDTIYNYLAKRFVLDSSFKDDMREVGKFWGPDDGFGVGYNEADDIFRLQGLGTMGYARVLGYVHNGGNKYTVYYSFEENGLDPTAQLYKVVLEFNRTDCWDFDGWKLNGEENKYLSFEKVTSTPSDMIK